MACEMTCRMTAPAFTLRQSLAPLMRKPDGERPYRGVFTRSQDGSATFVACGSDETWAVSESYPAPLCDDVGDSVLVDGTGYLPPRWLSMQDGELRPLLGFRSVSSVEPWDGGPCEGP